jgi:hypothetical protein
LAAARAAVKRVVKLLAMRAAMLLLVLLLLLLLGDVAREGWVVGEGDSPPGQVRSGRSGSIFGFILFFGGLFWRSFLLDDVS